MKRSLSTPLVALFLSACGREAPAERPTTPVAETPPPAVAPVRVACPAEAETIRAFPITAAAAGDHLAVEALEAPVRGRCEQSELLFSQIDAMARSASTIQTEKGPALALHHIHYAAALAPQKLVLAAADTGLWALDATTMARLARLAPNRAVDVVATPDGARFAYVRQDPQDGDTVAARELVIVNAADLAVIRRIQRVPEGRMRISSDGARVLFARGEDGVSTYDVASGRAVSFQADTTAEDAFESTDGDRLIGYVGESNLLEFRNLGSGAKVSQSTTGALPLVSTRNLQTVAYDAVGHRWLVGGDDEQVHEYVGMPGDAPRDAHQVALGSSVVDIACCVDGGYVATTGDATLALVKNGAIVRQVGPFLDDDAGQPVRVSLLGNDTLVSMVGRVFTWTADGLFVVADFVNGQVLARATLGTDTLLVVRSHGFLEFHRVPTAGGLAVTTTLLGRTEWQAVDTQFVTAGGDVLFVGRQYTKAAAALIPANGTPRFAVGPEIGVGRVPVTVPQGDGVHWAMWGLDGNVVGIDAAAMTVAPLLRVEGDVPQTATLSRDRDAWKLVDQTGATRTLVPSSTPAPAAPTPAPAAPAAPTPAPAAPAPAH